MEWVTFCGGKHDLKQTLKGVPQAGAVVLLAHEPDYAAYVKDVDLQLSGHSHGGQIRFPLLGAPVLPVMGRMYPQGLRRIGPLTLYTNVGIGTIWCPCVLTALPKLRSSRFAHRPCDGLRYMHSNPVKRGFVSQPEHRPRSSFPAYALPNPDRCG